MLLRGDEWLCFNELSQVEEYYSLSGVSPARSSALLLLCGEGELQVRSVDDHGSHGKSQQTEEEDLPVVSDAAISRWWSLQLGENYEETGDEVAVSLSELDRWVEFRMHRETARRIQGLREMLRLLFRLFCSDGARFAQLVAEGEVGAAILELAVKILGADAKPSQPSFAAGVLSLAAFPYVDDFDVT
eukprot:symbB.v1.2.012777.t1/scaffold859.1/size157342/2